MLFSLPLLATPALGDILLPSYIGSSMVFQRDSPFTVWGTDAPAASLSALFLGTTYNAVADSTGRFQFQLPAQPATLAPATVSLSSSASASVVIEDILFGDVFVSSGQSNMELTVSWCYNYSDVLSLANSFGPALRVAQVALLDEYYNTSTPQSNLTMNIPWARASSESVASLSAIAYFTAVQMRLAHPEVPIGAIATSWGGTAMQPWMPPDALRTCGDMRQQGGSWAGRTNADPGMFSAHTHPQRELDLGVPSLPSTLWNSMVSPLLSLSVSGWYWYQGESNVGDPHFVDCFPAMITAWRAHWQNATMTRSATSPPPFIFFQLGPWPGLDSGAIADMRMNQTAALMLPNVGMVVTADKGDAAGAFHPIHPPSKEELSRRAFLVTDNLLYGNRTSPVQGPQPVAAKWDAWDASWDDYHIGTGRGSYVCNAGSGFVCGGIRVTFDSALELGSTFGDLNSFDNGLMLYNDDMTRFQRPMLWGVNTGQRTLQLNTTWTWGEQPPSLLRYAHTDYPSMKLYNADALPVPPFSISIQR